MTDAKAQPLAGESDLAQTRAMTPEEVRSTCADLAGGSSLAQASAMTPQNLRLPPETLTDENNLLRTIIANLADCVYVKDWQGRFVLNNPAHLHLLGAQTQQDLLGQTDFSLFPPELAAAYQADEQTVMQTGQPLLAREEPVINRSTGAHGWNATTKLPLRDSQGKIIGLMGVSRDITERKRTAEQLQQTSSKLASIFSIFPDLYFRLRADGVILAYEANRATELYTERDAIVGRRVQDLLPAEAATLILGGIQETLRAQALVSVEYSLPLAHGKQWFEARLLPAFEHEAVALVRNITQKRQAEDALRESEQRYRSVIAALEEGITLQGADSRILACNASAERILGLPADQIMQRTLFDPRWRAIKPDGSDFPDEAHPARVTLRTGKPCSHVVMGLHRPDDSLIWISVNSQPLFGEDDAKPHTVVVSFSDITAQMQAQEHVRRTAARAEALVRVAARLNAQLNLKAVLETVCQEAATALNADGATVTLYDEQQRVFSLMADYGLPPKFREQCVPIPYAVYQRYADSRHGSFIFTNINTDSDLANAALFVACDIRVLAGCTMLREGKLIGILHVMNKARPLGHAEISLLGGLADQAATAIANAQLHDQVQQYTNELEQRVAARTAELQRSNEQLRAEIAERLRAESAQQASETKLRLMLEQMPAMLWTTDAELQFGSAMGAGLAHTPGAANLAVSAPMTELTQLAADKHQRALQGESARYERRHNERYFDIRIEPLRDAENQIAGTIGLAVDVTERKQAEEEIRRALAQEKELSELKSRFVSMTSHEFRTPLSTILSSAELLEYYLQEWPLAKQLEHLQRIQQAVLHMTEMLNSILVLERADAGKLELTLRWFDVEPWCRDLIEESRVHARANQPVSLQMYGAPRSIWADENLLRQALSNLLSNAIKYSAQGGSISLSVNFSEHQVAFAVSDQGIGIPPEDRERLFDMFHRGRNVGNIAGTGLGLAIVKKAVDLHAGLIEVVSETAKGATFTIILPQPALSGV